MFAPPYCPNRTCSQFADPEPRFFKRNGSYRPKCRPWPVPRYQCRSCGRGFSRQTFRMDYRDHRPDLNAKLFTLLASGVGLRQSSRTLGLSLRCTQLKFRKIARHLRQLNLSLCDQLEGLARFHFDELESYEGQRNARPLSIPVLVESHSRFIVWAESAPIRPRGKMTPKRRRDIERAEKRHGIRKDLSPRAVARTLARGARVASRADGVLLDTDEKPSYRAAAERAFGKNRLLHRQTNSQLVRATWNPLFAINHEEAMMRDLMGRLRRRSWLVSKKRRYLDLGLHVHMAYRNLVRRRFNGDDESPAQLLGFAPRRLTAHEVLSWRQERGRASIHPLSRRGESVREWTRRGAMAV